MRMSAITVLGRLSRMGKPVLTTGDAALHLGLSRSAATRALTRLAGAGLILPVRHGLWSLELKVDPLRLPEHLTAPFPAYVSLHSALQLHGMIQQLPRVIYVASLAPTRRIRTRIGDFSVHRLAPSFFGGFVTTPGGARIATPEKALLDVLYLTPARSRLFAALPEVEIPRQFDRKVAQGWVERIRPGLRREAVKLRLERLLGIARGPDDGLRENKLWYERNRGRLLARHRGEYVAVLNQRVVDHDRDFSALAARVFARHGDRPVFTPRVQDGKPRARLRSPRRVGS